MKHADNEPYWPSWVPQYQQKYSKNLPASLVGGQASNDSEHETTSLDLEPTVLTLGEVTYRRVSQCTGPLLRDILESPGTTSEWITGCRATEPPPDFPEVAMTMTLTCGVDESDADVRQEPQHQVTHACYHHILIMRRFRRRL